MTSQDRPVLQAVGQPDPDRGPLRRIAWVKPAGVYQQLPHLVQAAPMFIVIIALAVLDSYLMLPALQSVLRLPVETSAKVAYGISAAAALAAGWAGYQLRGATGNHPGSRRHMLLPAVVGSGWLLLGFGIAGTRLVGSSARASVSYDGAPAAAVGISTPALTGAVLFLVFYLLVGALAFGDLYYLRQDAVSALRRAKRQRRVAGRELMEAQALLRRLVEVCATREFEMNLLTGLAETAREGNAAHAAGLKQLSRYEQAVHLGSPSATGITSPAHQKNPLCPVPDTQHEAAPR